LVYSSASCGDLEISFLFDIIIIIIVKIIMELKENYYSTRKILIIIIHQQFKIFNLVRFASVIGFLTLFVVHLLEFGDNRAVCFLLKFFFEIFPEKP
jgi:hypothetical protein